MIQPEASHHVRAPLPPEPPPLRPELLERYKLAVAECRAEVTLGTERQKLFLALNPAVAAFASNGHRTIAITALALAAVASLTGFVLIKRSHQRYQAARDVMLERARAVGAGDDWQTTGGMKNALGKPRAEGIRVTTAIRLLLLAYTAFDVIAIRALLSER
jgi:hypothetical protein